MRKNDRYDTISHKISWYDMIRYDTIRSTSASPHVRTNVVSYSILKGRIGDRTPPSGPRLPTHALPVLSAISSSMQRNTCNARNATYARSGQWHGWNFSNGMTCVRLEACFGPSIAWFSLAYSAVHPRAAMYSAVRRCRSAGRCRW